MRISHLIEYHYEVRSNELKWGGEVEELFGDKLVREMERIDKKYPSFIKVMKCSTKDSRI